MWKESATAWLKRFLLSAPLVGLALLYLRYAPESMRPWQSKPGPVTVAQPTKEIVRWRVKEVRVPGPKEIVYLNKAELSTALKMPELNSTTDNVLAVGTIPPSSGATTTVALMNPLGETRLIYRQEPPKFLQVKREFGLRAGMGTGGLILGEVYARPLRIGPIDLEARAFVKRDNSNGADFGAVILADWRF